RHRKRRAQLLGEERNTQLLDQPAKGFEGGLVPPRGAIGVGPGLIALPQRRHGRGVLGVPLPVLRVFCESSVERLKIARYVNQRAPRSAGEKSGPHEMIALSTCLRGQRTERFR